MRTIEEFIREIERSKALQDELKEIKDKDALADFLRKNDVCESVDELEHYAKTLYEGELSDDTAKAVAGGIPLF